MIRRNAGLFSFLSGCSEAGRSDRMEWRKGPHAPSQIPIGGDGMVDPAIGNDDEH